MRNPISQGLIQESMTEAEIAAHPVYSAAK